MNLFNSKLFFVLSFFTLSVISMNHESESRAIVQKATEECSPCGSPEKKMSIEDIDRIKEEARIAMASSFYPYPGSKEIVITTTSSSSPKLAHYCETCRRLSGGH